MGCGSSAKNEPPPAPPKVQLAPELSHTDPVPSATSSGPAGDPRVEKMIKVVAKARLLEPTRNVPGVTLTRDDLLARVKAHVQREVPHQAIVDEGLVYQLLGQLPTTFDYEKQTYALLEAQLAGYYEPADGTMYLAKDLQASMADMTLSHELVHALQDHHYDLKARSKYLPGQSDLQTATSALAEGDATSAMIDVALQGSGKTALDLDTKMFADLVRGSLTGESTGNSPRVMAASLVAPYVDGTAFVNTMRRKGGWAEVDKVWTTAPTTTEQILHPEKWTAHEAAIALPPIAIASLGTGWATTQNDTYGELALRTVLEEWLPAAKAAAVAANWGGDSVALVKNAGKSAFAWRVRWDKSPADKFATDAFATIVPGAFAKANVKEATFACTERADRGPLATMRKGNDVVLVAGPATAPETGTWASAGDCNLARKWATEILSK